MHQHLFELWEQLKHVLESIFVLLWRENKCWTLLASFDLFSFFLTVFSWYEMPRFYHETLCSCLKKHLKKHMMRHSWSFLTGPHVDMATTWETTDVWRTREPVMLMVQVHSLKMRHYCLRMKGDLTRTSLGQTDTMMCRIHKKVQIIKTLSLTVFHKVK